MNGKLIVTASPHVHTQDTVRGIMRDVIIALLPAVIMSIVYFGERALLLIMTSVGASIVFEYVSRLVMKRKNTVGDLSAIVTGLLLALNVPSTLPVWILVIGDFVAIVIAKQMFGGIGHNFVNPALAGRIVLMTSFPAYMTAFVSPFDAVTTATPLSALQTVVQSGASASEVLASAEVPSLMTMFFGATGGVMGETCAAALLLGFIYMLIRRIISPLIPLTYMGVVAVIMFFAGGCSVSFMLAELLSGGLMLGAIFMATDYTTCPINTKGRVYYAIGCGLITCLIRIFGSMTEGVSFAIILMNILVPHIETLTTPKPFGYVKPVKEAKNEK